MEEDIDDLSQSLDEMQARVVEIKAKLKTKLITEIRAKASTETDIKKLLKKLSNKDLKLISETLSLDDDKDIYNATSEILEEKGK